MDRAAEFSPGRLRCRSIPRWRRWRTTKSRRSVNPMSPQSLPKALSFLPRDYACRGFPLLIEGSIKVVKNTPAGREMLLYRVEPGGSCVITSRPARPHPLHRTRHRRNAAAHADAADRAV